MKNAQPNLEPWAEINARVERIRGLARAVFTTDEAIAQWLAAPAPALRGARPMELLVTESGGAEVEALIQGMTHGNVR